MISQFTRDESGAVTVDYVVMTGGVVGLGLAVLSLVAGGVETLTNSIARALGTTMSPIVLVANDFSDGMGDWVGGRIANLHGFGDVLLLERGRTARVPLDFPADAREGILTFDVIAGDSLDFESAFFYVDGQLFADFNRGALIAGQEWSDTPAGTVGVWHNSPRHTQITNHSVEGISFDYEILSEGSDINLGHHRDVRGIDQVTRVTVRLEDPPSTMNFAANTNANQHQIDEFFAIDNFSSSYR